MVDARKSAQARRQRRDPYTKQFANEGKRTMTPTGEQLQRAVAGNSPTGEPDFDQLMAATDAFDNPSDARKITFDLSNGQTINGYALDDGRIDRTNIPDGWHAYSVMETEFDDSEDYDDDGAAWNDPGYDAAYDPAPPSSTLSILKNCHVNHRLDFITTQNLDQQLDSDELSNINDEHWGFGDNTLADDLAEQSGDDDFDLDIAREEHRKNMVDGMYMQAEVSEPTPERIQALRDAMFQTIDHDEENKGESTLGAINYAPSGDTTRLHLDDLSAERLAEAKEYGGWNPDKDPYVRFNDDGDLEGMTQEQADALIWNNRLSIIQAMRDDESAKMNTVNRLSEAF
ncbi:hypothetical protein [Bifidobacterium sp. SO1]|uniref:hypothetical protein n=1 Tax=Bifidobacterium sp. SO1 TaxID=2809029 RepID=UPI001BDC06CC|nr:hypothetical protein [Bifidobacterium sp. SO1]MBT1162214.1 hypothetical protein [Bifidobacterium sp. SO1]